ncbi:hypothetical protein ACA910_009000 [Epithemia clementina (nom. ined.)]
MVAQAQDDKNDSRHATSITTPALGTLPPIKKALLSDSFLMEHALTEDQSASAFELVRKEIQWCEMYHKGGPVPRQVAIQGDLKCFESPMGTPVVDTAPTGQTSLSASPSGTNEPHSAIGSTKSISGQQDENQGPRVDPGAKRGSFATIMIQPIYRHPADEQPALQEWTPTVRMLRDLVQGLTGQQINHALIQMYRNGDDYISEHADKTLDVVRGSTIFNLSLGATRTMVLRSKREQGHGVKTAMPREATRVALHHGSLFGLGWNTNQNMTHEIKRDKREERDKTASELDYNGCRISITFRLIATFLMTVESDSFSDAATTSSLASESDCGSQASPTTRPSFSVLFGQGAKHCRTQAEALEAVKAKCWRNGQSIVKDGPPVTARLPPPTAKMPLGSLFSATNKTNEQQQETNSTIGDSERLLQAFSEENRRADFDWEESYGQGFDVVNIQII